MTKLKMPKKENEINPEIIDTIDQCYAYFISRLEEIIEEGGCSDWDSWANEIDKLIAELRKGETNE